MRECIFHDDNETTSMGNVSTPPTKAPLGQYVWDECKASIPHHQHTTKVDTQLKETMKTKISLRNILPDQLVPQTTPTGQLTNSRG